MQTSIKILGAGCKKCNELEENTKNALSNLGIEATVEHVTDFMQIAGFGVMTTPALVVNGKAVLVGRVASVNEVEEILRKSLG